MTEVSTRVPMLHDGAEEVVRCVECDTAAEGTAEGWKAYIGGGFEDEPLEIITFCPDCAYREVGAAAFYVAAFEPTGSTG